MLVTPALVGMENRMQPWNMSSSASSLKGSKAGVCWGAPDAAGLPAAANGNDRLRSAMLCEGVTSVVACMRVV